MANSNAIRMGKLFAEHFKPDAEAKRNLAAYISMLKLWADRRYSRRDTAKNKPAENLRLLIAPNGSAFRIEFDTQNLKDILWHFGLDLRPHAIEPARLADHIASNLIPILSAICEKQCHDRGITLTQFVDPIDREPMRTQAMKVVLAAYVDFYPDYRSPTERR